MADYIYLMQNRLTAAQWRALEAVREAARTHGMPVFLVGGAVRDLTSGAPVRDLDFAIQGEARALVSDLESRGAITIGENPVLSSMFWTFRGGVRAEIGPTLSVNYPKPGKPEARTATILDDLRRRDFTANAMAVSLNQGSYGLLLDPLNGTADIENRELRLVSPYGFIEQPALLLRAARLSDRLGWSLEEKTQGRYETSKEEEHIKAIPTWDRGYELEEIFHEEDPVAALEHMEAEGWREVLFPALNAGGADRAGMDEVRDLIGQLESQRLYPDPSAVYFPLITAKVSEENRASLKKQFARQGFARQIEAMEARSKELANQLTAKSTPQPSDAWKLLMEADPEVLLWLAFHSRSGAVQTRIKSFLKEWPGMRGKIPYALMQEMRITADLPGYEQLLDDLFLALIDGKLDTPEATRAFLEPFSPPAPPQVSVRRRPAKSARGRGKRSAEPVVSEPEEPEEVEGAEEGDDPDDEVDDADEAEPELRLPPPIPLSLIEDEPETENEHDDVPASREAEPRPETIVREKDEEPPVPQIVPVVPEPRVATATKATREPKPAAKPKPTLVIAQPASKAAVKAATAAGSAGDVKAVAAKGSAVKQGAVLAAGQTSSKSPAKAATPAKTPAKATTKTPAKSLVLAKPGAKTAVAKKAAGKTTSKAQAKIAAKKTVGGKAVPAKATSAKAAPAKAASAKVAPAKVASAKIAAKKTVPVKVLVKKQPAKGRGAAPVKAAKPVKSAKKSVVKGRGSR